MATYAEFLRSQGATDDEIKILDTPAAQRAYTKMQSDLAAVAAERDTAKSGIDAMNKWFTDEASPAFKKMESDLVVARANEARAKAAILEAQKRGLVDVAKDLGYNPDEANPTPTPNPGASNFDPNRYFTRDEIVKIAETEGEAIAVAQDIAFEHRQLFPDKPLNFRALRQEALASKKPVEQYWMDKFGVAKAREDREAAARAANEDRIRKEEREKVLTEVASKYANPDMRPLEPSTVSFVPRPNTTRDKQPWERDSSSVENDRVNRVVQKIYKQSAAN